MKVHKTRVFHAAVLTMLIGQMLLAASCSVILRPPKTITVASKDFTEQFILAEMYAQLLENDGFKVTRKLNLGATPVVQQAIMDGQIDIYPEYTGTALLTVLKLPKNSDPKQVYETVQSEYLKQFNLVWLDPSAMNNTQALAMTQANSKKFGITTISEMVAKADQLVMIGPPEFRSREDGLPGLKKAYGNFTMFDYEDVDPGLRYQLLISGQADVVVAFSTDGEINAYHLVVLKDDRHAFPPDQVAPVVRQEVLNKYPEIKGVLNPLAALLTDDAMRTLNYEVSGKDRDPADVARDFLLQHGLIK